jgi:serine/threonine-protein kinase
MVLPGEPTLPPGVDKATKKYRPILEIGSGGMSRVYLAIASGPARVQKFHVIKRLLPTLAEDPEFLNMFLEEARLSARLNHPNVVQINEVGFDGEHYFMAMEYLEGQSLDAVVRWASRRGGLPFGMYGRVLVEAAQGLHYAHELCDYDGRPLGVVHRDVSPHNVFVTYQGEVKVLDFGVAKAADSAQHTRTGMLKGKVEYMAPERFVKGFVADRRVDVFALGVMLWQAVARRRLWEGLSHVEVFRRLSMGEVPSLRAAVPDAPEALAGLCERALAADPSARIATAADFAEELEAYLVASGQEVRARALAAYVSEAFTERRAQARAAIEAAVPRASSANETSPGQALSTGELPTLPEPSTYAPPPGALPTAAAWAPDGRAPIVTKVSAGLAPSGAGERGALAQPFWFWVAGAGLLLLGVGLFASSFVGGAPGARAGGAAAPGRPFAASAGAASGAPPGATLTRVLVAASPAQAQIFIDEAPLPSNPASAAFARDGQTHRVRAEAPGYRAEVKLVTYDVDEQVIALNLRRDAAPPPPPAPHDHRPPTQARAPSATTEPPKTPPPPAP